MTPQRYYGQATTAFAEGRPEEAIEHLSRALELNPDFQDARVVRGRAFAALREFERAERDFREVEYQLDHAPADVPRQVRAEFPRIRNEITFARGLIDLVHERFAPGWERYRAFYQTPGFPLAKAPIPLWRGEAIDGPLLVYADQGLGDGVQCSRYISKVAERCPRLHLLCDPALRRLLTCNFGFEHVWRLEDTPSALGSCRAYAPLLSLPGTFQEFIDGGPSGEGYLKVNEDLVARYRGMVADRGVLHVGVTWKGNPKNRMDRLRSFDPGLLGILSRAEGVKFYSLQREAISGEAACIAPAERLADLREELNQSGWDILDTASIVANLDLVVTCDTMIAHLAGALGVPVWVAIANTPDWRWGLREDYPAWYRSMRLFRQDKLREWQPVFERMVNELPGFIASRSRQG
jgi:hypothetical protein